VSTADSQGGFPRLGPDPEAARKRAATETYVRHQATLRRTARRYSICADDADEALQRSLEILLRKAPSTDPRELIRWTQTVVKHEALAVRRDRERILAGPAAVTPEPGTEDWVALLPSRSAGPADRAERRESVARSREALQALKPQELRALTLLAEGYSYAEIGEITGYSRTKINRCLAEGRERFRKLLGRSEDGRRCAEMRPLISAFCDGELVEGEVGALREHLRACAGCRATLRAYRAAPGAVAALAPALPLQRSLLERAHDVVGGIAARFGSGGAGGAREAVAQVAAGGGTPGLGAAAVAKLAAVCIGTVGGAAACVASGLVPAPLGLASQPSRAAEPHHQLERRLEAGPAAVPYVPAPPETEPQPPKAAQPKADPEEPRAHVEAAAPESPAEATAPAGAVEYVPPPPEPVAEPASAPAPDSGSPAGEFGP